jgi:hypothetical protein
MPFQENTYLVWQPAGLTRRHRPGLEPDLILDLLRDEG